MLPIYSNSAGVHWKKWPGRTACGAQARDQGPGGSPIDCPTCLGLVASWHPDAGWLIKSDAPLARLELVPGTVYTYRQAADQVKQLRQQQFRWKKALGFYPKIWLEPDPRTLRRQAS